jgi:hypothetical protein
VEVLFFEKKNQKTIAASDPRPISKLATDAKEQKFFGSFFQKRTSSYLARQGHSG